MEKPMIILQKNAERNTNKMRLPKQVIEQWGNRYYMEIYNDKIILKPIRKDK